MNNRYEQYYSIVKVDVQDNLIYLEDTRDGESLAINPDCWDLIKKTVDQQIEDGCLGEQE